MWSRLDPVSGHVERQDAVAAGFDPKTGAQRIALADLVSPSKTPMMDREVVFPSAPDIAFMLWNRDRHPDHEAASAICHAALLQPARLLGKDGAKGPGQIYWYDNGPGHTIDFVPDTYVDVTAEWQGVTEWLGGLMAFVNNRPMDIAKDAAVDVKTTLARYRGMASGARYAEAVRSMRPTAREWL